MRFSRRPDCILTAPSPQSSRFEQVYGSQPVLYVTEVHEVNEPTSLKALKVAFDWSDLRIYDVNVPGLQHGILLGTRRWK